MNPDLAMGDELLKKTGAGNLFMVFGEPDIESAPPSRTSVHPHRATSVSSNRRNEYFRTEYFRTRVRPYRVFRPGTRRCSSKSRASTSTIRRRAQIRSKLDRRHRLLVHRHRLQRRELLRPPRLFHRRRPYDKLKRALRAEIDEAAGAACTARSAGRSRGPNRQDRRQGNQPLRR